MSTTWEFLAGDTSRFAIRLGLSPDPFEGRAATQELSASWGFFEIWVEGINLCAQTSGNERLDAVHWYLLPLLEWFAASWDPLFHEERLPIETAASIAARSLRETAHAAAETRSSGAASWQSWWSRHSLLAARDGGLFPEVVFRRWRDLVEISWDSVFIPGAPRSLAFSSPQGHARLPAAEVVQPLATMLNAVVEHLGTQAAADERISALAIELQGLDSSERSGERLAWLAALGATFEEMREAWQRVAERFATSDWLVRPRAEPLYIAGTPQAGLMFGAVAPDIAQEDVENLTSFLLSLSQSHSASARADDTAWLDAASRMDPRSAPWRQGYDLAESVLDALDSDPEGRTDIDELLIWLGVAESVVTLTDVNVRGLAAASPGRRPTIALNEKYPGHDRDDVRRFTKGHELCHILFDRTASHEVAEASGPWASPELEQRANAFAAMLLMPERLLEDEFGGVDLNRDPFTHLADTATKFGVSRRALVWHATNLGFLSRGTVRRAEMEGFIASPAGVPLTEDSSVI